MVIVSGFASDLPEDGLSSMIAKVMEKPVTIGQIQNAVIEVSESSA